MDISWIGVAALQMARMQKYQDMAKQAGAKGIHIVGSIETGQELLQRFEMDDVFVGLMGNWLSIEPFLATGTVDAFVMEENCSPPAIDQYAEKYQVALVSVSTIIGVPGTEHKMPYYPGKAEEMAETCINVAIENFKKRHEKIKPMVPKYKQKAIAGFSTEAVLNAIGNDLNNLVDVIAKGQLKGIVALANCSTLRNGPQDWNTVNLTKELIKKRHPCSCRRLRKPWIRGCRNVQFRRHRSGRRRTAGSVQGVGNSPGAKLWNLHGYRKDFHACNGPGRPSGCRYF